MSPSEVPQQHRKPVTVEIEAIEPETLLDHPAPVSIQRTSERGAHGWMVKITGDRDAVFAFVAAHWGDDEALQQRQRLIESGEVV